MRSVLQVSYYERSRMRCTERCSILLSGVEMEMNLLPKIKIEIVVSLVPVQKVIETAKAVLHTGQIGDGKVFVYDIENVVKIRTGEEGYLALQDTK